MKTLARHSVWLFGARLATQAGMAVFTILVARRLGSAAFGEYAFIASILVIGNLLTTFGTDMHLIREIAARGDLRPLAPALALQIALSTIFVVGIFVLTPFLPLESRAALRIYSFSLFPLAFFTVFTTALRGTQHMGAFTLLNLLLALLQTAVAVLFNGTLVTLAWLLLLTQILAAVFGGIVCALTLTGFRQTWVFSPEALSRLIKASAPVAFLAVIGILYQRLSLTLLPFLGDAAETGHFSAAARLVEMAKMGHIAVFTAIYPLLAQKPDSRLPWGFLLGAALLGASALSLLAAPLVNLLFGAEYLPAVPILQILAWTLIPYTVNNLLSLAFLAEKRETLVARALTASLLGLAVLLVWWEPLAGGQGAAWAVLAAESFQAIILLIESAYLAWQPGGLHEFPRFP